MCWIRKAKMALIQKQKNKTKHKEIHTETLAQSSENIDLSDTEALSTLATKVAEFGDSHRFRRLSPNSATNCRRFRRL